jgi:Mlc titration factor MtfA (ptsG expression regulator)
VFGRRERRRAAWRQESLPPEWAAIVERNVPAYARLPDDDRRALLGHARVFLEEKSFEGAGGLELTDEIRVTIAAQASLLLLGLEDAGDYYPGLRSIVVYPHTYQAPHEERDGMLVHEGVHARLGESWTHGAVVLSWDGVRAGTAHPGDGQNLVLHEFAHQLDQADGAADGTPALSSRAAYAPWAAVLGERYLELRRAAEAGRRSVLDEYGATNEAEFFAVATEAFFEKPLRLRRRLPDLYDELSAYFGQDPAAARAASADEPEADG